MSFRGQTFFYIHTFEPLYKKQARFICSDTKHKTPGKLSEKPLISTLLETESYKKQKKEDAFSKRLHIKEGQELFLPFLKYSIMIKPLLQQLRKESQQKLPYEA